MSNDGATSTTVGSILAAKPGRKGEPQRGYGRVKHGPQQRRKPPMMPAPAGLDGRLDDADLRDAIRLAALTGFSELDEAARLELLRRVLIDRGDADEALAESDRLLPGMMRW